MNSMHDKVAVVTGGASGIGRATARLMAARGVRVVVADVDEAAGLETLALITQAGGQALWQPTDVRQPEAAEALVARALGQWGRLDMAFNNAGISGSTSLTEDQTLAQWRQVLDVNLIGVFNCMAAQLRAMKVQGGAIVNTASVAGVAGAAGAAAYSASKHGVIGLTRTAAMEYARHRIRINAVSPGYIETPMTVGGRAVFALRGLERRVATAPMRRMGQPEEIARTVLWLCSDEASYITGANHIVDGGVMAGV